jgi:hypothetical protein
MGRRLRDDIYKLDKCDALDSLHNATVHVRHQWKIGMNREEAKSNLDARAILFNCSNRILTECGLGISRAEVEDAAIIERQLGG